MLRWRTEARRGLRWGALSLASIMALTAVAIDPADARPRRKRPPAVANERYAAIVVDANSGAVLHSQNPDAIRHPASLTKIMTLFLLFERLAAGRLTLDTPLPVSAHAASQPPTRLGLQEGTTITVEEAIKGIITRSANDASVVVAESLAGSEAEFARQMTRKARALGMSKTVYRNASGLPDAAQVTTAADQAILGRAIQERFPRYYRYFATRSFTFRGRRIANHNRLLDRVEGVDGIKTGYTRASGFNLVTSMRRGNRHIVAVVLGGASAAARDARMRQLITEHISHASTRRTAPLLAEAAPAPRYETASAVTAPAAPDSRAAPVAGSSEPIRPVAVKTVSVRPGAKTIATVPPAAPDLGAAPKAPEPVARAGLLGYLPATTATISEPAAPATTPAAVAPAPASAPAAAPAVAAPAAPAVEPARKSASRGGWVIQVGAYPAESEARQRLAAVRSKAARLLGSADAFTEPVQRGETTLYRARFAVLDRAQAEAACRYLRANDVECLAIRN